MDSLVHRNPLAVASGPLWDIPAAVGAAAFDSICASDRPLNLTVNPSLHLAANLGLDFKPVLCWKYTAGQTVINTIDHKGISNMAAILEQQNHVGRHLVKTVHKVKKGQRQLQENMDKVEQTSWLIFFFLIGAFVFYMVWQYLEQERQRAERKNQQTNINFLTMFIVSAGVTIIVGMCFFLGGRHFRR